MDAEETKDHVSWKRTPLPGVSKKSSHMVRNLSLASRRGEIAGGRQTLRGRAAKPGAFSKDWNKFGLGRQLMKGYLCTSCKTVPLWL